MGPAEVRQKSSPVWGLGPGDGRCCLGSFPRAGAGYYDDEAAAFFRGVRWDSATTRFVTKHVPVPEMLMIRSQPCAPHHGRGGPATT